jgi:hypothetical protein
MISESLRDKELKKSGREVIAEWLAAKNAEPRKRPKRKRLRRSKYLHSIPSRRVGVRPADFI